MIEEDYPSFTCPECLMKSYNSNDIREGYCGACHAFTGRTILPMATECPECGSHAAVSTRSGNDDHILVGCSACGTICEGRWTFIERGDPISYKGQSFEAPQAYPRIVKGIELVPRLMDGN